MEWQKVSDDIYVRPALAGVVSIEQREGCIPSDIILVKSAAVPALIKALQAAAKEAGDE